MWKRKKLASAKGIVLQLAVFATGALVLSDAGGGEEKFLGRELFERMEGKWTSEGEFNSTNSTDVIYVTEAWTGRFTDDGKVFVIQGSRDWNGEDQTFKWEYTYNAVTSFVEVIYTASNFDEELPMEVSVNEVEGTILLRAPMGNEGAELQIENKFKKSKLLSRVTVRGNDGQTVLEGTLKHSRKKKGLKGEQ